MKSFIRLSFLTLLLSFSSTAICAQNSNDIAQAILNGANTNRVAALIRQGADVTAPSNTSVVTPLMAAASKGNAAMVKLLLKKGANPKTIIMVHGESLSAFDFASITGYYNLAKLLPVVGPDGKPLKGEARKLKIESDMEASRGNRPKERLYKISSWMDKIKLAMELYFQENGGFPGKAETLEHALSGKALPKNSIWNAVGFTKYPDLPPEIASISYIPLNVESNGVATSFGIVITLDNFGNRGMNGQLLGLSPSNDMLIKGATSTTSKSGKSTIPFNWHYSCHQMTDQPVSPLLRETFSNSGVPLVCR